MKKTGLYIGLVIALALVIGGINSQVLIKNEPVPAISDERIRATEEKPVKMGATQEITGLTITLNSVVQDFRCAGASCPEAGGVNVNITLDDGEVKETRNLASDEVPFIYRGYAVSITAIEPALTATNIIAQKDYIITFRVEPTVITDTSGSITSVVFRCDNNMGFSAVFSNNIADVKFDDEQNNIVLTQSPHDPHYYTFNDNAITLSVEGDEASAIKNGVRYSGCSVR